MTLPKRPCVLPTVKEEVEVEVEVEGEKNDVVIEGNKGFDAGAGTGAGVVAAPGKRPLLLPKRLLKKSGLKLILSYSVCFFLRRVIPAFLRFPFSKSNSISL